MDSGDSCTTLWIHVFNIELYTLNEWTEWLYLNKAVAEKNKQMGR